MYYALAASWRNRSLKGAFTQGANNLADESAVFERTQNITFPLDVVDAEKIMVIVVPQHNAMSGGIYSMISIARHMRRLKWLHGFEVLVVTIPNPSRLTYFRNTNFQNSENIYRFEQILRCTKAKEIYLHLPEYASSTFVDDLSRAELDYLLNRHLHVNLLNQNIRLMHEKEKFASLRKIADGMSQSAAHHSYAGQAFADRYDLPTILLPAYTDLSDYPPSEFEQKEKLIIYSFDDAPHKDKCLKVIANKLPDYKLVEIRGITFDRYMDYATRCMFSISFGEGFDGYVAQPIYQGGIGFTVYNDEFFPSDHFKTYENFFESEDEMVNEICDKIVSLAANREAYVKLNKELLEEYHKLYKFDEYIAQLKKLSLKQFEVFPKARAAVAASNAQPKPSYGTTAASFEPGAVGRMRDGETLSST
ncbi:hypothetical protein JQ557_16805 [Bradyrhizobium sp. U87765 SZCCT0131]|uniref:hypothetical protein n=1 Tax=unclassified Bradyrhizobium TaxID=2631580 RepID=UPI001BA4BB2E|nr:MULTISPECIES: hypothetical protein [unclassified Bradyrhizobium]MBR1219669.1 hypothetical protein [Bradyrhizobium sp. U87765 SZCCT0131]MBR1262320.1 hypothetical protein [Bradyrhizobium sp. U87765 SZCCT0134]MBR1308497.1 hypothetical protein [Bradyrhizobium sp. U87765 SZCCT0110]MBR1318102.1 hypothetical protein [Bradyrhizobium sp. U87765 SZCCT0109]MBR1351805.1 hypothetical protein [Bradyrhizobium sp. U87765 SZCCT0048]